jgi:hypothetical protein
VTNGYDSSAIRIPMLEQLPLICEPAPGESGLGYCLRSVCRNGLNLHWLRQAAGVGYRKHLDGKIRSAAVLDPPMPKTLACGCAAALHHPGGHEDMALLRPRSPVVQPSAHSVPADLPQVHSRRWNSVAQFGSWRPSRFVCAMNARWLMRAPDAVLPLRWDRPAIDICNCGRPFGSRAQERPVAALLEVTGFMVATFNRQDAAGLAPSQLPSFLGGLSTHGLLSLIHAFGVLEGDFSPDRKRSINHTLPPRA